MTPNLGQGACQAIEDAVGAARCLNEKVVHHRRPARYERLRFNRTAM
jgi:2-polyprenyl-6-methoxyphenol hydroxylase-like FAD-dependent oxidoreductase